MRDSIRDQDDAAYAVLLDDDFEFDPLERDEVDWPWFDGFWGRDEELSSIGNMFDPSFAGVVNPIDTIECEITAIGEPITEGDLIHITCNLRGAVLTSQNDGWSFDTMLEMTLVRRGDVLRIRKVAESDLGGRFDDGGIGHMTWGRMKALFYTEPPGL